VYFCLLYSEHMYIYFCLITVNDHTRPNPDCLVWVSLVKVSKSLIN
jgi:hypothetical protein